MYRKPNKKKKKNEPVGDEQFVRVKLPRKKEPPIHELYIMGEVEFWHVNMVAHHKIIEVVNAGRKPRHHSRRSKTAAPLTADQKMDRFGRVPS